MKPLILLIASVHAWTSDQVQKPGSPDPSAKPQVAAPAPQPAQSQSAAPGQPKHITNVFTDSDLKQALGDMATQSGAVIVPDETVTGTISANLKDVPLETALDIILAPGNYSWLKQDGYYLVGKAEPTSPNFLKFATSHLYKPNYITPERMLALLPASEAAYVKAPAGELELTVTAAPSMYRRIMQDMQLVDKAPPRIILEALVTEVTSQTLNQYNFSWLWRQFGLSSDTQGSTFTYTKAVQSDVDTMKLLVGQGKAEVRANPRIMTVEGKEALVEVAQENYFQVITGPASFPYASVQDIKTGVSLKMTPTVASNGDITIQLNPEVSDAVGSGNNGLPINTVRRATTTVRVKDGETIVIGGMSYLNVRKNVNKIPILGDVPVIGQLFRTTNNIGTKTEVIIMVTPHLLQDTSPPQAGLELAAPTPATVTPAPEPPKPEMTQPVEAPTQPAVTKEATTTIQTPAAPDLLKTAPAPQPATTPPADPPKPQLLKQTQIALPLIPSAKASTQAKPTPTSVPPKPPAPKGPTLPEAIVLHPLEARNDARLSQTAPPIAIERPIDNLENMLPVRPKPVKRWGHVVTRWSRRKHRMIRMWVSFAAERGYHHRAPRHRRRSHWHAMRYRSRLTASATLFSSGMHSSSRTRAYGIGTLSPATRDTGASRSSKQSSPIRAAISAPKPPLRQSS